MAMKRISHIFILLIFLSLSGCMTKIYLGKEKEPEKVLSDDMVMSSRAIDPTTVPAGGTWGTVRGVINTNFTNINGTLDSVEVTLAEYGDSITNYYSDIQLRLLKSDTASMLANYTRNGELNTALTAKVSVSDTAAMLANYALTSELGEAGIGISDVRDEIADSLNVLRPLYVATSDTAAMLDGYAKLSDLSEGGISLSAVQEEIADSLINYVATKDSAGIKPGSYVSGYTFQQGMMNKISVSDTAAMLAYYKRRLDSIADVLKDSVNIETLLQIDFDTDTLAKLSDVRSLAGSGVVGVTLNSGTLTLTGDAGTADDITFYTNGNGEYNLPTGGGNLTIQSQVQAWLADSLDVLRTADSDTIPLFVFGLGSGHSSDTAIFNNGRLAGAFYNSGSDTLYVTELRGVLVEGTGTETIDVQVSWDVNMKDATPTNLNTTALTVTNMTTGTVDTSFDNNGIPPGMWIWCTLSGASANNKPTMLTLTMTGYRRNRSY